MSNKAPKTELLNTSTHVLRLSNIKVSILANYFGRGIAAGVAIVLAPVYIKILGAEAYGLVGTYISLQILFSLLDIGLGPALNRELARLSVQTTKAQEIRNLVRTIEFIYWILSSIIVLITLLLAPLLAQSWFKLQNLSEHTVQQTLMIMSVAIALQFMYGLYSDGLLSLQRQVTLNVLTATMALLRGVGVIAVLNLVAPTIEVFFIWQIVISLTQTLISRYLFWHSLPKFELAPRFEKKLLMGIWRFALGVTGIDILSLLHLQMDKILLSNLLTLEAFGYYNLANVVSSILSILAAPISAAVFPQLTRLVALDDESAIKVLYHRSCQLMAVVIISVATVLCLFAPEILRVWLGDPIIVEKTSLLVSLLVAGTALNNLMLLPYYLMLAYGWVKLSFYQNLIIAIVLIPALLWIAPVYGAVGAAVLWILVNTVYIFVTIQVMHTRLLKTEKLRWYSQDFGLPSLGALVIALPARLLLPAQLSLPLTIGALFVISALTLFSTCLATALTRNLLKRFLLFLLITFKAKTKGNLLDD